MNSLAAYQLRPCARAGTAYIVPGSPGVLFYSVYVAQQGSSAGVQSFRDALSNGTDGKLCAEKTVSSL